MRQRSIITTSWDDGHPLDLRLVNLLRKYGIKGTFYVPIRSRTRQVLDASEFKPYLQDIEIGSHTLTHTCLIDLPLSAVQEEISKSKDILEKILNTEITSFSYPLGKYNSDVIKVLKSNGFCGARTADIFNININDCFRAGTTLQATNRSVISYLKNIVFSHDKRFFLNLVLKNRIRRGWPELAKETLRIAIENDGIWHLWGHSWEMDLIDGWRDLENVFEHVKSVSKDYGIEILGNGEIFKIYR